MEEQRKKEAAATIVGFGLAKAATSLGYLSAMGSVGQSVGFVTELWFMFASEAASIIVASLVIALACRGAVKPGSFAMWPGVAALVAGFAASAVFAQAAVALEMAPLLGVLYGIGQTVVSIAWLDIFSMQESERSHICMVCGLVLQAFIVAGSFCFGYGLAFDLIVCAMAACSLVCYRVSVALAHEPARTSALGDHGAGNAAQSLGEAVGGARAVAQSAGETIPVRRILLTFGPDYWCLFALVGVVGILHTSVLESSSEHIVGDVSMAAPLFASTAVASAIALVVSRRGNPAAAYKACLPVMLVVLSLMPFIGDALGPISGTIMIMCYDVCGMLFLFYIANASRETGVSSFALSGIYLIGSNAFLALGLAAGWLWARFRQAEASRCSHCSHSLLYIRSALHLCSPCAIRSVKSPAGERRCLVPNRLKTVACSATLQKGMERKVPWHRAMLERTCVSGAMRRLAIRWQGSFGKALSRRALPCRMFHRRAMRWRKGARLTMHSWTMVN